MKQRICETERAFIAEGLKQGVRRDGRGIMDNRSFKIEQGTIVNGYGSTTLTFGEKETSIICSVKAEIAKPLPSDPNKGQLKYYLESS